MAAEDQKTLNKLVQEVMSKLRSAGLTINHVKSTMRSDEVSFLGYKVSIDGIKPHDRLVKKILNIKPPTNKKELESFVGLVNFYGKFINQFAKIILPLNELRNKGVSFAWTSHHQESLDKLKKMLSSEPVIKPYDVAKELTLTTDASEGSIGGVLTQEGHPILYLSRKLTNSEKNYSTIEKEALGIVWAVRRARNFLIGRKFNLISDHQPF